MTQYEREEIPPTLCEVGNCPNEVTQQGMICDECATIAAEQIHTEEMRAQ